MVQQSHRSTQRFNKNIVRWFSGVSALRTYVIFGSGDGNCSYCTNAINLAKVKISTVYSSM